LPVKRIGKPEESADAIVFLMGNVLSQASLSWWMAVML
jgi:hypothetical protein